MNIIVAEKNEALYNFGDNIKKAAKTRSGIYTIKWNEVRRIADECGVSENDALIEVDALDVVVHLK